MNKKVSKRLTQDGLFISYEFYTRLINKDEYSYTYWSIAYYIQTLESFRHLQIPTRIEITNELKKIKEL